MGFKIPLSQTPTVPTKLQKMSKKMKLPVQTRILTTLVQDFKAKKTLQQRLKDKKLQLPEQLPLVKNLPCVLPKIPNAKIPTQCLPMKKIPFNKPNLKLKNSKLLLTPRRVLQQIAHKYIKY